MRTSNGRTPSRPATPTRAAVAASYDLGVDAYVAQWSAVILPPAQAVVATLDLAADAVVLDIGGGTGALAPAIEAAAPACSIVVIDASRRMLGIARDRTRRRPIHADAMTLPVRDAAADAALLAYVLFHLSDPRAALAEAARVLRPRGEVGTVTWQRAIAPRAEAVWEGLLGETGAPQAPPRRLDTGLDSRAGVTDLLCATGFEAPRVWVEHLTKQWAPESFWQLASGSGLTQWRLRQVDPFARRDFLERAREHISKLTPSELFWEGEVVCAVAARALTRGSRSRRLRAACATGLEVIHQPKR